MRGKKFFSALLLLGWFGVATLAAAQSRDQLPESGLPGSESYGDTSACTNIQNFSELVNCVTGAIIQPIITLLLAAALGLFLWGVVQYLRKLGSKEAEEAKKILWWGIIALFVMVSVWGLVGILVSTFGLNNGSLPNPGIPQF